MAIRTTRRNTGGDSISNTGEKALGAVALVTGLLLFLGGFYLLPIGTDVYLYFFVEKVANGNWFWGSLYANLAAVGMIVIGFIILKESGNEVPGKGKNEAKKGGKK